MFVFLCIITVVVFVLLILVAAMQPEKVQISEFELDRRVRSGDRSAMQQLHNQALRNDIESILRVKTAFLLVACAFLLVVTFGWLIGSIVSVIIVIFYGTIARLKATRSVARSIYTNIEPMLFQGLQRFTGLVSLIKSDITQSQPSRLHSRQELQHLIDISENILSADEKKLIVHSLEFSDKVVADIMTPANSIVSIKKSEFLGPLTLDELHKSGHSRLPVIYGDINKVVGILHLQNLLALDTKRSVTAEKAMDSRVLYVRQDQTLPHALGALLRSHYHLFIVINELRETVGLVTLDDIIEALIGRKIIDEFDGHESSRAVAEHDPHEKSDDD